MISWNSVDKSSLASAPRYYDQVVDSIVNAILNGELNSGDKLPSERELAEQFGISRVPIREAIKALQYCGVVAPAVGGGVVIKSREAASFLRRLNSGIFGRLDDTFDNTADELFEVRLLLEGYAAEQAAKNRTEEDLRCMKEAIEGMKQSIARDEIPVRSSVLFHGTIIAATQNALFIEIYNFLHVLLSESRNRTLATKELWPVAVEYHQKIYDCIAAQDSAGAKSTMHDHLRSEWRKVTVNYLC